MNFINLYKKKIKTREQMEDFLTETIAFLCRISNDFKSFYLKNFLGIEFSNIDDIRVETQVRTPNEDSKEDIPDLIISDKDKIICVCEHKIESNIHINGGINQLDKYHKQYGNDCKYLLIYSKFNIESFE